MEIYVKSFGGRRSHRIAPIVDHPIGRNAIDDLPIPQNKMQLGAVDIQSTRGDDALGGGSRLTKVKRHAFVRLGQGEGLYDLLRQKDKFLRTKRRNQRRLALQPFLQPNLMLLDRDVAED